jgi:hypothetical protein
MAHFAELDTNNIVLRVIVINNEEIIDDNGLESEELGIARCFELAGPGKWIQTSYNNSFRKRYAGIGMKYYEEYDGFGQASPPYLSWSEFDVKDLAFLPPSPRPEGQFWHWDEEVLEWKSNINI